MQKEPLEKLEEEKAIYNYASKAQRFCFFVLYQG